MYTLNCRGRMLAVQQPLVMGVVNVTPDSFYPQSRFDGNDVLGQVEHMLAEGADIIDIGAQSSRPHAALLSAEEELARIGDLFAQLHTRFPETIFSVDTFYSRVARECVQAGASIVNDISGGSLDDNMLKEVGQLNVPFVCMHMKGIPQTMAKEAQYTDVVTEVLDYFIAKLHTCRAAGIRDVIVDPGFGFSKNAMHNFQLLRRLDVFKMLGVPLLAGLSRKSTIYNTLGVSAGEALNGTTVLNTIALLNGANILRVHDVKEARECVKLCEEYRIKT